MTDIQLLSAIHQRHLDTLRKQRDAAVANEQNCRAINNRLIAENAALKKRVDELEEQAGIADDNASFGE